MRSYTDPKKDRKTRARSSSEKHDNKSAAPTADNRPEAVVQQKVQEALSKNSRAMQLKAIQEAANTSKAEQAAQLQAMAQQHAMSRFQQKENPEPETIQKKENKTGMPDHLKTGVENMSGMDMSDVKVHYNSPKPKQLQAHAYAQGADIHLGPGQEKHLPHEAWHVVQQKQGRVQPTKQLKGTHINDDSGLEKEADVKGQAALQAVSGSQAITQAKTLSGTGIIQRKWKEDKNGMQTWDELVDGVTWFANGPDEMWYEITGSKEIKEGTEKDYKVYEGQKKSYDQWRLLRLGISLGGKLDKGDDKIDKVDTFVDTITAPVSELIGYEGISGVSDSLLGRSIKTGTGGKDDISSGDKKIALRMGGVSDTITGLTGITAFVKGLKDATDPDKDLDERFVAFLSYEQGAMSIGESVSKLTATATGSGTASKFGSTFEGFSAGFSTIKEAFQAVKKSIDTVKAEDLSTPEKMKSSGEIILHALEATKSAVLSVKSFYELATGSASGKLMATIPGAGIAISALKLIMQGYYTIQSYNNYILLNRQENFLLVNTEVDTDYDDISEKREKMEEASEFYRKNDAKISNKQALIAEDKATIKQINEKEKKETLTKEDKERRAKREKRIKRLEKEIEQLKKNKHSKTDDGLTKENLAEFTMIQELKGGNIKRMKRQGIHIAVEMARIAGEVAILTGVGGIGGGIVKGVSGGVELSLPLVRGIKQKSRNYSGREEAKRSLENPLKYYSSVDTSKTDHAKKDFRLEQVRNLVKMAIALAGKDPKKSKKDFQKLKLYLSATGVNIETLFKKNGKPDHQINMLFEALSKREFLD